MSRITAIRSTNQVKNGSGERKKVFVDGRLAFTLTTEVVDRQELHVGQDLTSDQIKELTWKDRFHHCLNAANLFLIYRPRSEFELRERLQQRGYQSDCIESVITRLKEQKLVDDFAFAQFWIENRDTFSPRSRWLKGQELKKKGVSADIINEVLGDADDIDGAYRAASSRARRLLPCDYQTFHRRLGDYLKRRGFGYGVISQTVKCLWQELEQID